SEQGLTEILVDSNAPVIVAVDGGSHYVLVTGKIGNTFQVLDPGSVAKTTLSAFSNWQTRGYVLVNDPIETDRLTFVGEGTGSQVDLLVTAPNGQESGLDPSNGTSVTSIPQSVVYTDSPEDTPYRGPGSRVVEFVDIFQAQAGTCSLAAGGGTVEPFTIF